MTEITEGILPIPGFPGYAVSSQGNIWSFKNNKPRRLKGQTATSVYFHVSLRANGETTCLRIHRLVLQTFAGPAPDGMECRHLNGDPKDNRLENLCWGTKSENRHDSVRHGRHQTSRLTNAQIREIRTMPGLHKDIAAKFGISRPHVTDLKSGKCGDYSLRVRAE